MADHALDEVLRHQKARDGPALDVAADAQREDHGGGEAPGEHERDEGAALGEQEHGRRDDDLGDRGRRPEPAVGHEGFERPRLDDAPQDLTGALVSHLLRRQAQRPVQQAAFEADPERQRGRALRPARDDLHRDDAHQNEGPRDQPAAGDLALERAAADEPPPDEAEPLLHELHDDRRQRAGDHPRVVELPRERRARGQPERPAGDGSASAQHAIHERGARPRPALAGDAGAIQETLDPPRQLLADLQDARLGAAADPQHRRRCPRERLRTLFGPELQLVHVDPQPERCCFDPRSERLVVRERRRVVDEARGRRGLRPAPLHVDEDGPPQQDARLAVVPGTGGAGAPELGRDAAMEGVQVAGLAHGLGEGRREKTRSNGSGRHRPGLHQLVGHARRRVECGERSPREVAHGAIEQLLAGRERPQAAHARHQRAEKCIAPTSSAGNTSASAIRR